MKERQRDSGASQDSQFFKGGELRPRIWQPPCQHVVLQVPVGVPSAYESMYGLGPCDPAKQGLGGILQGFLRVSMLQAEWKKASSDAGLTAALRVSSPTSQLQDPQ